MQRVLAQKNQQGAAPLADPLRQPSPVRHLPSSVNTVPPRCNLGENQPPASDQDAAKPVSVPGLNPRLSTKQTVPTMLLRMYRHSKQKPGSVLANGISKFPVWARSQKPPQQQHDVNNVKPVDNLQPELDLETPKSPSRLGAQLTFVDNPELGVAGSEPTFELACQLASVVRCKSLTKAPVCSNCKLRPQAAATHCFSDWCTICDDSLYASRFTENVPVQEAAHGSSTSSGSTGDSDGSLSGDFQDNTDPIFTLLETKTLIRFFPVTFPSTLL